MILSISYTSSDGSRKNYDLQMEYSYIDEKSLFDEETQSITEKYLFAYNVDEENKHFLNGEEIKWTEIRNKPIFKMINNSFIVNSEIDREILKSEFSNIYFILLENLNEDYQDSLLAEEIY
jgi:Fe-S cluster assembly iron-binding protein IscA